MFFNLIIIYRNLIFKLFDILSSADILISLMLYKI